MSDPLAQLLAGRYLDRETGALLAADARAVVIEPTLAGSEATLVADLGITGAVAVVSDVDTHAALGARVERALAGRFAVQSLVLPRGVAPDTDTVARLVAAAAPATAAVVAVGSGTINDLCKMLGHARGIPQLVFATAPSMNGYTSLSASILDRGFKRSVRTATPVAALFDLRVLAAAPPRLIRAGLGDSACRPTAQTDWLLQHLVLGRPYRSAPFELLAGDEDGLLGRADALVAGDLEAMRHLVRTLVLSGFGMTICGGSYPASQGEHLLAHYMEMAYAPERAPGLHGEHIGVTALAMARLQERILARAAPPAVRPTAGDEAAVVAHFGPEIGAACWRDTAGKRLTPAAAAALGETVAAGWPAIRARLLGVAIPSATLHAALAAAGAPTTPAALGWPAERFMNALRHAAQIRDRFTFLDLAEEADLEAISAS